MHQKLKDISLAAQYQNFTGGHILWPNCRNLNILLWQQWLCNELWTLLLLAIRTLLKHISANVCQRFTEIYIAQLPMNFIRPKNATPIKLPTGSLEIWTKSRIQLYQQTILPYFQSNHPHLRSKARWHSVANLFQPGGQVHGILHQLWGYLILPWYRGNLKPLSKSRIIFISRHIGW